jgi:hypothetical protein
MYYYSTLKRVIVINVYTTNLTFYKELYDYFVNIYIYISIYLRLMSMVKCL